MIKTYSLRKEGDTKLTEHFVVREMRCKGGEDEVKIDDALMTLLERLRTHFDKPLTITSGYRSPAYNVRINGAKASQHLYGTAADIRIDGIAPREIAEYAETLNPGGIGLYEYKADAGKKGFTHVDTRARRGRWLQTSPNGKAVPVDGFYPNGQTTPAAALLAVGSVGPEVLALAKQLDALGYLKTLHFDAALHAAVCAYQKANGLQADGKVGAATRAALAQEV